MSHSDLVENFFRHEYGRLVSTLSRLAGPQHIEAIEDAAQSALMAALDTWPFSGTPDNPAAWLFTSARNALYSELRKTSGREVLLAASPIRQEACAPPSEQEAAEDMLRMLALCCHEDLPTDSQLAFALKTLCGFGVREIALRLFTTEANVYKRIQRARKYLRDQVFDISSARPNAELPDIQRTLYVLFTEGYLSAQTDFALRVDLCEEATRLTTLLANQPLGRAPTTFALLALMHFHLARMASRQDATGGLLLLEEQDRRLWDVEHIQRGLHCLGQSASGSEFTAYHAEAGVAAEHCLAPTFNETRWDRVVSCYELLEQVSPSPLHKLNKAVAIAEWKGPEAGLQCLVEFVPPPWLAGSYQWFAVLADLFQRSGQKERAEEHARTAFELAPTPAIEKLLRRRLNEDTSQEER